MNKLFPFFIYIIINVLWYTIREGFCDRLTRKTEEKGLQTMIKITECIHFTPTYIERARSFFFSCAPLFHSYIMMNKVRLDQTNAKVERHNIAISIELLCNNYIYKCYNQ